MSAVDDLTELVQRAAAAEKAALASKWKERHDVEGLRRHVCRVIDEQRDEEKRLAGTAALTRRRAGQMEAFLSGDPGPVEQHADDPGAAGGAGDGDPGDERALSAGGADGTRTGPGGHAAAARAEADAVAAV